MKNPGLVLVLVIFLAVLLAATVPWPFGLRVSGRLIAQTVTVVFDHGAQLEPDLTMEGVVRLDGLGSLQAPPEIEKSALTATFATVNAKHLILSAVRLGPGAEVTFDAKGATSGAEPWLLSRGGTTLQFEAEGPLSIDIGTKALSTDLTDTLPILAVSGSATGSSHALSLSGKFLGDFEISDLPQAPVTSQLSFGRRTTAQDLSAAFVSTIVSGSVKLVDVGREQKIDRNGAMQLRGFHGYITAFRKVKQGFEVGFAGTLSELYVGPAGFAEDISPTSLEYLYHQDWLKLMWVVAAALLAAIVKVRSWILGKSAQSE